MTIQATFTELAFREGTSDKFYRAFAVGSECVIQYGRAGTYGTFKRTACADHEAAVAAAAKQADAKFRKGYEMTKTGAVSFPSAPSDADLDRAASAALAGATAEAPSGERPSAVVAQLDDFQPDPAVFASVLAAVRIRDPFPAGESAPVRPMLAENADPADLGGLLESHAWAAQFKYDGDRYVVEVVDGIVSVFGRNGQAKVREVNAALLAPFRHLTTGRWVFDGEMVGRTLVLFDLVDCPGLGLADFDTRYDRLCAIIDTLFVEGGDVVLAPTANSVEAKRTMLGTATTEQREGIMFRRRSGPYRPGRTAELLKHKFVKELDCVVMAVGVGGKQNAVLGVHDDSGRCFEIGQVTAIGKGPIAVGDVLEVRYLYVIDPASPVLYQPRIMRKRTDKAAGECSIAQLEGAGTNKAVTRG